MASKFEQAAAEVRNLTKKPTNEELLALYGLYKQATSGDNNTSQPWAVQLEARAKWDAWKANEGLSSDAAKEKYIALVDSLKTKYA